MMIATRELIKRRKDHGKSFYVTAKKLAVFFESVEAEEQLLTQRLHDASQREILHILGEGSNQSSGPPPSLIGVQQPIINSPDPISRQVTRGHRVEIYDKF
jgi:hypothetical protein